MSEPLRVHWQAEQWEIFQSPTGQNRRNRCWPLQILVLHFCIRPSSINRTRNRDLYCQNTPSACASCVESPHNFQACCRKENDTDVMSSAPPEPSCPSESITEPGSDWDDLPELEDYFEQKSPEKKKMKPYGMIYRSSILFRIPMMKSQRTKALLSLIMTQNSKKKNYGNKP